MTRILLLALLFLLVGIAIGLLISARRSRTRIGRPPPLSRPGRSQERLVRRLIGGLLLLGAALVALGYAYYSD